MEKEVDFDFLENFDNFGVKFGFRIKNKESYTSKFGGVTFILFFILSIAYFMFTFPDFLNRKVTIDEIKAAIKIGWI